MTIRPYAPPLDPPRFARELGGHAYLVTLTEKFDYSDPKDVEIVVEAGSFGEAERKLEEWYQDQPQYDWVAIKSLRLISERIII